MAKTWADRHAEHYNRLLASVVAGLRRVADDVERQGAKTANRVDAPEHGWAAHNVIHEITWGVANLNLSALILAAAEADRPAQEETS